MAERRMFAKSIIDTDVFLEMPLSAQALYFHLAMRADDEGFVSSPKRIRTAVGASEDDMKILIAKRYILVFDSGVVVIKHWWIHNLIKSDRFKDTTYFEEKNMLSLDEKKAYVEAPGTPVIEVGTDSEPNRNHFGTETEPKRNRNGTISEPQVKLSKDNINIVPKGTLVQTDADLNEEFIGTEDGDIVYDASKHSKSCLTKTQRTRFERFWSAYPKKQARGNAEKAWMKISPDDEETNRILVGLENSKLKDRRFQEKQFTPMPASWLNARCWEDDFKDPQVEDTSYDIDDFMANAVRRTHAKR